MKLKNKRLKAFTLTEMLVVLVIIGILVLIALPNFTGTISETRSKEAQLQLKQVYTLQKKYFWENAKYSNSLEDIRFEQQKLANEGGSAHYRINITSASNATFTAKAEAITDFDADGTLNIWEVNQNNEIKEIQKD